jgi:hypothetical protein
MSILGLMLFAFSTTDNGTSWWDCVVCHFKVVVIINVHQPCSVLLQ